jgi:uncharacterized membrane protein YjjP (DUF1212 family)
MNQPTVDQATFEDASRFIIKLGLAAHSYGANAIQLEGVLTRLTAALGFHGSFRSTPTDIVFAFQERDGPWQRVYLVTKPRTGSDLDKLAEAGGVADAVTAGTISVTEGTARLDSIAARRPPWGKIANALSYAVVGSGLAILFGGSLTDALVATILAVLVYGMVLQAGRWGVRAVNLLPLSTAFAVGALAAATKTIVPELNLVLVTVSAVAVLLPGYTISLGIVELASHYTISGAANLIDGLVYLVKQFLGAWLGVLVVASIVAVPAVPGGTPADPAWLWLLMPLVFVALAIIFQTTRRDFVWVVIGCAIAYAGLVLGGWLANDVLGTVLGATLTFLYADLWARWTGRPETIALLPAMIVLVSGSIGFRGLAAIADGQTAVGTQQLIQMFVVAIAITAGLIIANTIRRPRASL